MNNYMHFNRILVRQPVSQGHKTPTTTPEQDPGCEDCQPQGHTTLSATHWFYKEQLCVGVEITTVYMRLAGREWAPRTFPEGSGQN